ncbi:MAG: hypothetical protein JWN80_1484 [Microbacteriaceae bacterium]|nr:hypothetical protein [Microbacteriaceae bacterium]
MTNSQGTPTVAAGWYADYEDASRLRWWDGTQWTDHVSDPAASYVAPPRATVAPTTRLGNVFIWILVCLPLLSIVPLLLTDYTAIGNAAIAGRESGNIATSTTNPLIGLIGYAISAAAIVLAFFDWRALKRVGVIRPFHWAWAFFAVIGLGIVYVIGRSVVVHRRSGRGLAPLWAHIGFALVYLVVVTIKVSQLMSVIFANLPAIPAS